MKRVLLIFLSSIFAASLLASGAYAIPLGTNITIFDGVSNSQNWHGTNEDQEVEPGCVADQSWDLEGFFLNGSTLTMVGGFDFANGNEGHTSSLFIDTTGDAGQSTTGYSQSGNGNGVVSGDNFGYEYAINFDFGLKTYELFDLTNASTVSVFYAQNEASNPMGYASGGDEILSDVSFLYNTKLANSEVAGLLGDTLNNPGSHNALSINLVDLTKQGIDLNNFTVHYTMYCGNDNLMGNGTAPVPEPATMLLFGIGLTGMAAITRRKLNLKK